MLETVLPIPRRGFPGRPQVPSAPTPASAARTDPSEHPRGVGRSARPCSAGYGQSPCGRCKHMQQMYANAARPEGRWICGRSLRLLRHARRKAPPPYPWVVAGAPACRYPPAPARLIQVGASRVRTLGTEPYMSVSVVLDTPRRVRGHASIACNTSAMCYTGASGLALLRRLIRACNMAGMCCIRP
jgi:hypothetical protein